MFWPVLIDQLVGRFLSAHRPWPPGPRNCGQSSQKALAASCQWNKKAPSNITLIRMFVINPSGKAMLVNSDLTCCRKNILSRPCALRRYGKRPQSTFQLADPHAPAHDRDGAMLI